MALSPPTDHKIPPRVEKFYHLQKKPQKNSIPIFDPEKIRSSCINQLKNQVSCKQSIAEYIQMSGHSGISSASWFVLIYYLVPWLVPWLCTKLAEIWGCIVRSISWLCTYANWQHMFDCTLSKLGDLIDVIQNGYNDIWNCITTIELPAWPSPLTWIDRLPDCPEWLCTKEPSPTPNVFFKVILVIVLVMLVAVLFLILVNLFVSTFERVKASWPNVLTWPSRTEASDSKKETEVSEPPTQLISDDTRAYIREAFSWTLQFAFTVAFEGYKHIFRFTIDQETTTEDDENRTAMMLLQTAAEAARLQRDLDDTTIRTCSDLACDKQLMYQLLASDKSTLCRDLKHRLDRLDQDSIEKHVFLQFIWYNKHRMKTILKKCLAVYPTARTRSKSWNTRILQGICVVSCFIAAYKCGQSVRLLWTMEGPFNLEGHYTSDNCTTKSYFGTSEFAKVWNTSNITNSCQVNFKSGEEQRNQCYSNVCKDSSVESLCRWIESSSGAGTAHSDKCDQDIPLPIVEDCVTNELKTLIDEHSSDFVCNDQNISADKIVPVFVSYTLMIYFGLCFVVVLLLRLFQIAK